ncbi:MAG TPA: hypothetical protein VKQ34_01805 [Candidatus Saccharimonadales bacterium]|nr:hypothetical protein [Candidatus Saccharimonadales bacterium]
MNLFVQAVARILASRRFLYVVLAFFVFESVWVALSARYPMAFDEDFHFGIIKIYSHHWLPFLSGQPANSSSFGAVARDPSYLYHYLMSFPYRLLTLGTHSQTLQIVVLRLINVLLFGSGQVLFYRLLRRTKISPALANLMLALFVLLPIVPLVAGQINYDNLLFPLVAWTCLLVWEVREQLRQKRIPLATLAVLLIVCLLTSLVKYAFLPLFAASWLFVAWECAWAFKTQGRTLARALLQSWRGLPVKVLAGLAAGIVLAAGLFAQRYATNIKSYHQVIPDCAAVLSQDECFSYGPWARDFAYKAYRAATPQPLPLNAVTYTGEWLEGLHYRLFFMISGPANDYENYPPLPLPAAAFVFIVIAGVVALLLAGYRLVRENSFLVFLALATVLYTGALWADNFKEYHTAGAVLAVNGRYLLPLLLPAGILIGRALGIVLRPLPRLKAALAIAACLLFLQGGGIISFWVRSDPSWYWPNKVLLQANRVAHDITSPIVFQGGTYF